MPRIAKLQPFCRSIVGKTTFDGLASRRAWTADGAFPRRAARTWCFRGRFPVLFESFSAVRKAFAARREGMTHRITDASPGSEAPVTTEISALKEIWAAWSRKG